MKINEVSRWGKEWQSSDEWESHTVARDRGSVIASAYLTFIKKIIGVDYSKFETGLDIGAGAGYIAAAIQNDSGINMTATEWSEEGVELLKKNNPQLEIHILDILSLNRDKKWDVIICREVYPFTRVNAFTDQYQIISNIIDLLKPNGVFLLVGSDVSYPNCIDYKLIKNTFSADSRLDKVTEMYLESILIRVCKFHHLGKISYLLLNYIGELIFKFKQNKGWAAIRVMGFKKSNI